MPARQWGDQVELVPADLARELERENHHLRLLAAEPHYIEKVKQVMGPLSLWDKPGLDAHVDARVKAALVSAAPSEKAASAEVIKAACALVDAFSYTEGMKDGQIGKGPGNVLADAVAAYRHRGAAE